MFLCSHRNGSSCSGSDLWWLESLSAVQLKQDVSCSFPESEKVREKESEGERKRKHEDFSSYS